MKKLPFNTALIIPTGIGASIGGFGGDAMTLLPLLSAISDNVITHPNVANAACFQTLPPNTLYVEGYALDQFFQGEWSLTPVRQNRVGILWDSGIAPEMEILHRNAIAAVETVYGVEVVDFVKTEKPVSLGLTISEAGRSAGEIQNPDVLLKAGEKLLKRGATALAVCCLMPEVLESLENQTYQSGEGVDPIGGIEAMISHLMVSQFQVPAAHAPIFPYEEALPVIDHLVDPKAASEFMVSTFLPCVLTGLAKAPQFETSKASNRAGITVQDISALVVPGNALGSIPVLSAIERNVPILAVQNNQTVMDCPPEALGLEQSVVQCANYMEALGYLIALKEGISLPKHFKTSSNAHGAQKQHLTAELPVV